MSHSSHPKPPLSGSPTGLALLGRSALSGILAALLAGAGTMLGMALGLAPALGAAIGGLVAAILVPALLVVRSGIAPIEASDPPRLAAPQPAAPVTARPAGPDFVPASALLERAEHESRPEAVAIELARYKDVVTILNRQIDGSTEVTETAAFDIVGRLQTINETLDGFLQYLEQAERGSASAIDSGARAVAANSDLIRRLRSLIESRASDGTADRQAYAQIANEADQFSESLEAISRIAFQTHVIAVNASIEAARLGPAGRGFTIVAGEVRDLAHQANQVAKDVGAGLSRLRTMTNQRLSQKSDSLDESFLLDAVEKQSRTAEEGFRQLSERQRATLAEVTAIGSRASQDVLSALGGVQFQDIVRQRLAGVKAGLEHMGEHATVLADALLDPAVEVTPVSTSLIRQMEVDYVMASQFEAHGDPADAGESANTPVIELF